MDTTQFLASLWGPVLLAVSIGMFFSRHYYEKIYRDIEKDALAALSFGLFAMSVGIAQVQFHNTWNSTPQIIVSLLGWGSLIKGATLVIAPQFADRASHTWLKMRILPLAGIATLIAGAYLTYIAYFA